MKNPGLNKRLAQLGCALLLAVPAALFAEPPATAPQMQSSKVPTAPRSKPQVIYHVRPSSNYAATLHSQAKSQTHELPIDSSMPTSLQLSRSNANAAAAEAQAQARMQPEAAAKQPSFKPSKVRPYRVMRPPSAKGKGPGPARGNKPRKK